MARTRAQQNRAIKKEVTREYLAERGSVQYYFDVIEKIEALNPESPTFANELKQLTVVASERRQMIGKYLPDLKAQEIEHSVSDDLVKRIERTIVDSAN
jgi:hypothetical protein